MHGNVWEWTDSAFAEDPRHATGSEDTTASARVCRGGSWNLDPSYTCPGLRYAWPPRYRFIIVGFRVARALR